MTVKCSPASTKEHYTGTSSQHGDMHHPGCHSEYVAALGVCLMDASGQIGSTLNDVSTAQCATSLWYSWCFKWPMCTWVDSAEGQTLAIQVLHDNS